MVRHRLTPAHRVTAPLSIFQLNKLLKKKRLSLALTTSTDTMGDRYTDASADVLLQSKEPRTFRVHSYILKANRRVCLGLMLSCG